MLETVLQAGTSNELQNTFVVKIEIFALTDHHLDY